MLRQDPVVSDLARHLAEQDRREAHEEALDQWLESHGPNAILDVVEGKAIYKYRLANRIHNLMTRPEAGYSRDQVRSLFIEMLAQEAAESDL